VVLESFLKRLKGIKNCKMVEARGIEPLSKNKLLTASTCLAKVKISSKKAHFPKTRI